MSCGSRDVIPGVSASLQLTGTAWQRLETIKLPETFPILYFFSSWFAIGAISAYDAYLVNATRLVIRDMEQNPICLMLINCDPDRLSYFFVAKAAGTLVVLSMLAALYCWKRRLALPTVTGVMTFQIGLLLYLSFAQR